MPVWLTRLWGRRNLPGTSSESKYWGSTIVIGNINCSAYSYINGINPDLEPDIRKCHHLIHPSRATPKTLNPKLSRQSHRLQLLPLRGLPLWY